MAVVVVESPAKAKTINKYLGPGYTVLASYGHVRDLPSKDGSVDPDHGFAMTWEVAPGEPEAHPRRRRGAEGRRQPHPRHRPRPRGRGDLLAPARGADRSPRRQEGHRRPTRRLQRHHQDRGHRGDGEAAPDRPGSGPGLPRPPRARLPRRLPPLARALAQAAGRPLRRPRPVGRAAPDRRPRDGDRGLPRAASTGPSRRCSPPRAATPTRPASSRSTAASSTSSTSPTRPPPTAAVAAIRARDLTVSAVEAKPATRNPAPPFMTSTLQQEASRKFGMGARQTMSTAQRLYEAGHITYMRTDGIDMAPEAVMAARDVIRARYGAPYLPSSPAHVQEQGQERPGGARVHPPDRHGRGARRRSARARPGAGSTT